MATDYKKLISSRQRDMAKFMSEYDALSAKLDASLDVLDAATVKVKSGVDTRNVAQGQVNQFIVEYHQLGSEIADRQKRLVRDKDDLSELNQEDLEARIKQAHAHALRMRETINTQADEWRQIAEEVDGYIDSVMSLKI